MKLIVEGLAEACRLIWTGDPLVFAAALRSLWVSSLAVVLAALVGLPVGMWLGRRDFFGSAALVMAARAGMAIPTVFVGILCYAFFSRRGPLGPLEMLYTPWAIVIGEWLLAAPIIVTLTHGAIRSLDERISETARTLGAAWWQRGITYLSEARIGVMLAILTAFGRCVTELGIAMMVGGNIKGRTRTLATATAMETARGEFARGLAMGGLLLVLALSVTLAVVYLAHERER